MNPLCGLVDASADALGGVLATLVKETYPQVLQELGVDPHRHGFRFSGSSDGTLRVRSDPHPLWRDMTYDRGHGPHGTSDLRQQYEYLRTIGRLARLQDALRDAGEDDTVMPPYMMYVPLMLRAEIERRGLTAEQILQFTDGGRSLPQLVTMGKLTDKASTKATSIGIREPRHVPESGPAMLIRRYATRIDVVMMEIGPGLVIEETVKSHELRILGQNIPETVINSLVGRRLGALVAHDALSDPRMTISRAKAYKTMTKVKFISPVVRLADVPPRLEHRIDELTRSMQ